MTGQALHVHTDMRYVPDAADAASAVLERLPSLAGTQRRLELLTGGLTNRNYRVSLASGEQFVARFAGAKSSLLAIDRDAEYRNSVSAAQAGVGPEVVEYAPKQGVLLVKWINGRGTAGVGLSHPQAAMAASTVISAVAVIHKRDECDAP